ncbi:hypothetical protein [Bradyrhizobium sp. USDA 4452]
MIPVQPPMQGQPLPQPQQAPQQPVTIDAVMALLRDGMTRRFRIDIEVDSTITGDESQERQDRTQFIQATTQFVQAWGPIVQQNPAMTQLAGELLLFGTRSFRVGRSLEEVIEETVDKLEAQAAAPKPPPQPSPDEVAKLQGIKMKADAEGQKAQMQVASAAQQAHHDQQSMQLEMGGKVMDHQMQKEQHAMEMQKMGAETALDAQALRNQAEAQDHKHELSMTEMDRRLKEAKKPKGND